uniref:Transmembrane protein n=1 Tax=Ditylenchus dipsaci TaxID=166011 RepID=A0A915E286_9BILA
MRRSCDRRLNSVLSLSWSKGCSRYQNTSTPKSRTSQYENSMCYRCKFKKTSKMEKEEMKVVIKQAVKEAMDESNLLLLPCIFSILIGVILGSYFFKNGFINGLRCNKAQAGLLLASALAGVVLAAAYSAFVNRRP